MTRSPTRYLAAPPGTYPDPVRRRIDWQRILGIPLALGGLAALGWYGWQWWTTRGEPYQRIVHRFGRRLEDATIRLAGENYYSPFRDASRVFDFDEPDPSWRGSPEPTYADGAARFADPETNLGGGPRSDRAFTLAFPAGFDPDDIASVEFDVSSGEEGEIRAWWTPNPTQFVPKSSTSILLGAPGVRHTYRLDAMGLRGWRSARYFRFTLPSALGEVSISRVAFVSRYAPYVAAPAGPARPSIGGVLSEGFYVVTPGVVGFPIRERIPREAVLDLSLALLERDRAAHLTIVFMEGDRGTPIGQAALKEPSGWLDVELPLDAVEGKTGTIEFRATSTDRPSVVLVGAPKITAWERGTPPPSFLVYVVDAMRADALSALGSPKPTTPRIDALAERGTMFSNCFAASDWTRPSVSTLLTGLYPVRHGNTGLWEAIRPDAPTLAERFRDAGYETLSIVANYQAGEASGLDRGFERVMGPACLEAAHQNGFPPVETRILSPEINKVLFEWLRRNRHKPFFVYLHSLDPHGPYEPPEEWKARFAEEYHGSVTGKNFQAVARKPTSRDVAYVRSLYDAEVAFNDDRIGEMLDHFEEKHAYGHRLFTVVTSDHGEGFFEHGQWTHTETLYDEEIRIPLVVAGPRDVPEGVVITDGVTNADLAPTLLELAGIDPPEDLDGTSLVPLFERARRRSTSPGAGGGGSGAPEGSDAAGDAADAGAAPSPDAAMTASVAAVRSLPPIAAARLLFSSRVHTSIREVAAIELPWKLIVRIYGDGTIERELFRLDEDPRETQDLADRRPDLVKRLGDATRDHLELLESAPRDLEGTLDVAGLEWLRSLGYLGRENDPGG